MDLRKHLRVIPGSIGETYQVEDDGELVGVILRIGDDEWLCYGATRFKIDGNRDVATRAVLQAPYPTAKSSK
jgi:hypothetical protein